ncbi:FliA/WhiG family RNA polymerase sigma factor [Pseudonocardia spinosispora]|uniref:FliA/WhiG family RNA polymerase sigma factor n=1 Tax=Pseudonocardia spinosispora TaxID=103441 RepID=UPI000A05CDE2|nr:FliA/WhiG family RNA polymerase sigma factor [Pseudonocardia spinosispora]
MTKLTLERDSHVGDGASHAPPPPASPEPPASESGELWAGYTSGRDQRQRDRLVLHYEPLVRQVAGRVGTRLPTHVELADLIQAGVFGLMDAIDRFEPDRGIRFEAYAAQRIRGAILDELRAQDWVPRGVRNRVRELAKARETVEARLQRRATAAELAAELGVSPHEARGIVDQIHLISIEALDEWAAMRGVTITTAETLPQDNADPVAILEAREITDLLARCIARLPERDRRILRLYYAENMTLAEIGRRLGVTESRVSQLRSRAVERLRIQFGDVAEEPSPLA